MTELSRRGFLHGVLAGGGALALAACGGGGQATRIRHADQTGELTANLYITVRPDGRIALIVNKAEIGQGVSTGYATMVAEELGAPLDHIDVTYAGADKRMRRIGLQITGGSTSTAEAFGGLRKAAASAHIKKQQTDMVRRPLLSVHPSGFQPFPCYVLLRNSEDIRCPYYWLHLSISRLVRL